MEIRCRSLMCYSTQAKIKRILLGVTFWIKPVQLSQSPLNSTLFFPADFLELCWGRVPHTNFCWYSQICEGSFAKGLEPKAVSLSFQKLLRRGWINHLRSFSLKTWTEAPPHLARRVDASSSAFHFAFPKTGCICICVHIDAHLVWPKQWKIQGATLLRCDLKHCAFQFYCLNVGVICLDLAMLIATQLKLVLF